MLVEPIHEKIAAVAVVVDGIADLDNNAGFDRIVVHHSDSFHSPAIPEAVPKHRNFVNCKSYVAAAAVDGTAENDSDLNEIDDFAIVTVCPGYHCSYLVDCYG